MDGWLEVIGRMGLAAILGGMIGWEREVQEKPAGLRTMMLVSLASAIYVMAAQEAARAHNEVVDSVRAMAGVAGGVGFLGAGAIIQSRGKVRWLTTAAALWVAAALGLSAGLGVYPVALAGGLFTFAILSWLSIAEKQWVRKRAQDKAKGEAGATEEEESQGGE